jgi:hypothetical protein
MVTGAGGAQETGGGVNVGTRVAVDVRKEHVRANAPAGSEDMPGGGLKDEFVAHGVRTMKRRVGSGGIGHSSRWHRQVPVPHVRHRRSRRSGGRPPARMTAPTRASSRGAPLGSALLEACRHSLGVAMGPFAFREPERHETVQDELADVLLRGALQQGPLLGAGLSVGCAGDPHLVALPGPLPRHGGIKAQPVFRDTQILPGSVRSPGPGHRQRAPALQCVQRTCIVRDDGAER